jgi:hypothetical protein
VNEWQKEYRKRRGSELAAIFRIEQQDGKWIVPSSKGGKKKYVVTVEPTNVSCTCPDHQKTGEKCKHIYAVEHLLRGDEGSAGSTAASGPDPVPRGAKPEPLRPTYRRNWSLYNLTLTAEQDEFEPLAAELCRTIPQPEHPIGRHPVPFSDAVLAAIIKVYLNLSERRVTPRLHRAYELGYLETPITLGTVRSLPRKA